MTTIDGTPHSVFQQSSTKQLHQQPATQLYSNHHPAIASINAFNNNHNHTTPPSPPISKAIDVHPQHPDALFLSQNRPHSIAFTPVSQALPQEEQLPASSTSSSSHSSPAIPAARIPKPPKMTSSPRNAKRDIHAPDFAYEVKYPVQPVPDTAEIPIEQQSLMPDPASDIAMKKYATSVDERNFLTVYEYSVNNQWVMWDYYTGYVHLTGLWKAIGNNKADIVKLIDNSPDLEPMIRRVRGGFLKIQGTWVPFQVAQALAARTCFHIRYALIPVFGKEFPESCLKPHEPGFGQLQMHLSTTPKRRRKRVSAVPHSSSADNLVSLADTFTSSQSPLSSSLSAAQPLPHKRPKSTTSLLKRQYPMSISATCTATGATTGAASPQFTHMAPPPIGLAPLHTQSQHPLDHTNNQHFHHHHHHHHHPSLQYPQYSNHQSPGLPSLALPAGPAPYHAGAATPTLYSPQLAAAAGAAAASPSPSLFYASPQTIPVSASPAGWPAHHDVVCGGSSSSDDDEPLLMAPTSTGVSSLAMIAAAARSASGSRHSYNHHHHGHGHGHGQYRYRQQHSNRLLMPTSSSGVSTPNSSLPNSPVLVEKMAPSSTTAATAAVPLQYQPPPQVLNHWGSAPITPPPAEDSSAGKVLGRAGSAKSLNQMSMLAAVADAVSYSGPPPIPTTTPHPRSMDSDHSQLSPFTFDTKPTTTTTAAAAPASKQIWPWTATGGHTDGKVILPLPGTSPSSSSSSSSRGSGAAPTLCSLARVASSTGSKAMSINNLLC